MSINVLKIHAHLATRVQPLRNDGVYRQPREYEASDELEVDHPQSELDAFILSEYPMPGKKKLSQHKLQLYLKSSILSRVANDHGYTALVTVNRKYMWEINQLKGGLN